MFGLGGQVVMGGGGIYWPVYSLHRIPMPVKLSVMPFVLEVAMIGKKLAMPNMWVCQLVLN